MSNDSRLAAILAEHQEEQRRKERGLMTDQFNLDCNLPPLPKIDFTAARYPAAADSGERTRASDPVNRKHSHYFRDVSKLTDLDVYRICDLFVDDRSGATQHAVKKLLLPGLRGAKDRMKDYQEAVDTLNRKIEMMKEDVI